MRKVHANLGRVPGRKNSRYEKKKNQFEVWSIQRLWRAGKQSPRGYCSNCLVSMTTSILSSVPLLDLQEVEMELEGQPCLIELRVKINGACCKMTQNQLHFENLQWQWCMPAQQTALQALGFRGRGRDDIYRKWMGLEIIVLSEINQAQ